MRLDGKSTKNNQMNFFRSIAFSMIFLILGCSANKNTTDMKAREYAKNEVFTIAPLYPDSVYFSVEAVTKNETTVNGLIEGFENKKNEIHELYFQRFVEKQNNFRIIHCIGNSIETNMKHHIESSEIKAFNDTVKFDELGIFEGAPADPLDLVPLFPGYKVKMGEYWKPEVQIKTPVGSGIGYFSFVIDSVTTDVTGSRLARIRVEFTSNLAPVTGLPGATANATGNGWLIWDCIINQRKETHLSAVYSLNIGSKSVKIEKTVNDKLNTYYGKKLF